jgi:hypothetical protein
MPYTVEQSYKGILSEWTVPRMPDLTGIEPWGDDLTAFWHVPIDTFEIDVERTGRLADLGYTLSCGGGNQPHEGTSYGQPFNLVLESGPKTAVWNLGKKVVWNWFRPTYPNVLLPLPSLVRREGDPGNSSDSHWVGYDPSASVLYEVIQLNNSFLNRLKTLGTNTWALGYVPSHGWARWNTAIAWNAPGQPVGVCAASVPKFPMVTRYEEVESGRINHALFTGVPDYAPEIVGHARGTDGSTVGHPLRGGERLRLKPEVLDTITDPVERIFGLAAHEFGLFIGDRNWSKFGKGGWTITQDVRWQEVNFPVWDLDDFEVIAQ